MFSHKYSAAQKIRACEDYLSGKGDHDLFWKAVESSDADAKAMLLDALRKKYHW